MTPNTPTTPLSTFINQQGVVQPLGQFMSLLTAGTPTNNIQQPQTLNFFQPQYAQNMIQRPGPPGGMTTWGLQQSGAPQGLYPNIQIPVQTLANNQMNQTPTSPSIQQQTRPRRQVAKKQIEQVKTPSPAPIPTIEVEEEEEVRSQDDDEEEEVSDGGDDTQSVAVEETAPKKPANDSDSDAEIDEDDETGRTERRRRRRDKNKPKKRLFTRELKMMMYGFGDKENPLPETVDLMDDLVTEYITDMTCKAMRVASKRGKFVTEDLVFVIRRDKKKFARSEELLIMNEEIKRARRMLDDDLLNPGNKKN